MALMTVNYFNILPTDIIGIFINDCDIITITNFFSTCNLSMYEHLHALILYNRIRIQYILN